MTILFWASLVLTAGGGLLAVGRWLYAAITKDQSTDTPDTFTFGIIAMSIGMLLFFLYLMLHMQFIIDQLKPAK